MIVDCAVHRGGRRAAEPDDFAELHAACLTGDAVGWLGLYEPGAEEFTAVAREFGLHEPRGRGGVERQAAKTSPRHHRTCIRRAPRSWQPAHVQGVHSVTGVGGLDRGAASRSGSPSPQMSKPEATPNGSRRRPSTKLRRAWSGSPRRSLSRPGGRSDRRTVRACPAQASAGRLARRCGSAVLLGTAQPDGHLDHPHRRARSGVEDRADRDDREPERPERADADEQQPDAIEQESRRRGNTAEYPGRHALHRPIPARTGLPRLRRATPESPRTGRSGR